MHFDLPFVYRVCGLTIGSDFPLDELASQKTANIGTIYTKGTSKSKESDSKLVPACDITVIRGDTQVPFQVEPTVTKPFSKFNAYEFYFELPGVIRILVRNGSEINLEILTEDINYALQFVYQNAIPIALLQRGIISFRASSMIDKDGKVWLFFAQPRSGMTSNAIFLMERGLRFFSDSLVALRLDNDTIFAAPFGPSLHIWKPVFDKQNIFNTDTVRPIRESIPKYVATINSDDFDPSERLVRGLIQVEHIANTLTHEPINMVDAFETLRNAVYHNHLTSYLGLEPKIFAMLTTMVKRMKLIRASRPKNKESFHELAEYIDTQIIHGPGVQHA
jgi:hypothetical protein